MKYMKKIVLLSITLCVVYLPIYCICAKLGIELSDTLTEKWFTVFGVELGATALIKVFETIKDMRDRRLSKKEEKNDE